MIQIQLWSPEMLTAALTLRQIADLAASESPSALSAKPEVFGLKRSLGHDSGEYDGGAED